MAVGHAAHSPGPGRGDTGERTVRSAVEQQEPTAVAVVDQTGAVLQPQVGDVPPDQRMTPGQVDALRDAGDLLDRVGVLLPS
jgi:hypothetical protein